MYLESPPRRLRARHRLSAGSVRQPDRRGRAPGRAARRLALAGMLLLASAPDVGRAQTRIPDGHWELVQNGPQPDRALHGMIFDPVSDSLWSFGGVEADTQGSDFHNSVWRFALGDPDPRWSLVPISGLKPPPLIFHSTVYDPLRQRMIVYGGQIDRSGMGQSLSDGNTVWFLDLTDPDAPSWTRQSVAGILGDRFAHAAVYVPGFDAMVVSGGASASNTLLNTNYALLLGETPLRWQRLANAGFQARAGQALIHDAAHQRLLVYGGFGNFNSASTIRNLDALDLSAGLDGADVWTRVSTANPGLARAFTAHFFDAERGLWWVHGGQESANRFSRRLSVLDLGPSEPTWTETNWVQNGPLDRFGHTAAWDPQRGIAWFQGGTPDNNRTLADLRALVFEPGATPTASASPTRVASPTATGTSTPPEPTPTRSPTTPPPDATPTLTGTPTATGEPPSPTPTRGDPSATPSPPAPTATRGPTAPAPEPPPIFLPLVQRAIVLRPAATAPAGPTATGTEPAPPGATPTAADRAPTLTLLGHYGGEAEALALDAGRVYLGVGPRIEVLDRASLAPLGRTAPLDGLVRDLVLDGTRLYVGHGDGLAVLDVADPARIQVQSALDLAAAGAIRGLTLADGLLLAAGGAGLQVFDLVDPAAPTRIGTAGVGRSPLSVAWAGGRAYVGHLGGLTVFDLTDPANPAPLGELALTSGAQGLLLSGDLAYVAGDRGGLQVVDVADPAAMSQVASLQVGGRPQAVDADGSGRLYLATRFGGLSVVDLADPRAPTLLASFETPGRESHAIGVRDGQAYLADGGGGLQVLDLVDPAAPAPRAAHPVAGRMTALDLAGDRAYTVQAFKDARILDARDPAAPGLLGRIDAPQAEDALVEGDRLYLARGFEGIAVFDVADPAAPRLLSTLGTGGNAMALALEGSVLHLANLSGYLAVDVSDPTAPVALGALESSSSALQVQARDGLAVLGTGEGVWVLDTRDPAAPTRLAELALDGASSGLLLEADRLWIAGGAGDLQVYDLSEPSAPIRLGRYDLANGGFAIARAGDRLYVGSAVGLEVFDVRDPAAARSLGRVRLGGRSFGVGVRADQVWLAGDGGLYAARIGLP